MATRLPDAIRNGMVVRSADGHQLGRIVENDQDSFVVEKGVFFPIEYRAEHSQIADVRDDEVWLHVGRASLEADRRGAAPRFSARERLVGSHRDLRIPEEQALEELRSHGQVKIHKFSKPAPAPRDTAEEEDLEFSRRVTPRELPRFSPSEPTERHASSEPAPGRGIPNPRDGGKGGYS